MANEIRIRRGKNGNLEVQSWNPRITKADSVVFWKNTLEKEVVTVNFPYPDPKFPTIYSLDPGQSSPLLDLRGLLPANDDEYLYSVLADDRAGQRSFVHNTDPKIIVW